MDRREGRGMERGGFGGERKMYHATCSDCGAECEVPFEPKEGRPVYCRDCYRKHKRF
ncbi:MAG: CxxC-x17-CxxC domain-containing protein [Candidatus Anstonellales archaeon]